MRDSFVFLLLFIPLIANGQTQRLTQPSVPPGQQTTAGSATETVPTIRKEGWSYDPDAGIVLQRAILSGRAGGMESTSSDR
ncbi:MAG: hypothetical protein M3Y50_07650 [Acidobacteriota bacterium]|nr:hypothetical protein [Acidobacteriota bacterium]